MFGTDLVLPASQREAFKVALGREMPESELDSIEDENSYLTVGDVVSLKFREHGVRPRLSVYDGLTERRGMTGFARLVEDEPRETVVNPAGTITAAMADAVRRCIGGESRLLRVEGEEDLALLPCLIYAPIGSKVVYGMPGRCMMVVDIDQSMKDTAEELVSRMEEME